MTTVITNPVTNISGLDATLNMSISDKSGDLYFYGFWVAKTIEELFVAGQIIGVYDNPAEGNHSLNVTDGSIFTEFACLTPNTDYYVAAFVHDGANYIIGNTVSFNSGDHVSTYTGAVKIESVEWTGLIITVGEGKDLSDISGWIERLDLEGLSAVFLIYSNLTINEGISNSLGNTAYYLRGVGSAVTLTKNPVRDDGVTIFGTGTSSDKITKIYLDNFVVDLGDVEDASKVFEFSADDCELKTNKVLFNVNCSEAYPDWEFYQCCCTCLIGFNHTTINSVNTNLVHFNMNNAFGTKAGSYITKLAYNEPWSAVINEENCTIDKAVIGTEGYGYEAGVAGALIEIVETPPPSTGGKVMILR